MKPLHWVGSSKKDLLQLPDEAQDGLGYALYVAQIGEKPDNAKPMKGFGGAGVLEVVERHDGDTYRAVYTVKFEEAIYVLHCFQKKSKSGIATPAHDIDLINQRYKIAEQEHAKWQSRKNP